MKRPIQPAVAVLALATLWLLDFSPGLPVVPVFVPDAQAVVGRPATPVSAAGVARRTTRRAVYATSASASAQQQQAQQQAQPATPAQPAAPPKGSALTALPEGCESMTIDGGSYFNCGGTVYKPTFQGSNLVYIVQ